MSPLTRIEVRRVVQHRAVAHGGGGASDRACSWAPPTGAPIPPTSTSPRVRGTKNPDIAAIVALAPGPRRRQPGGEPPRSTSTPCAPRVSRSTSPTSARSTTPHGAFGSLGRMLAACGLARPAWLDDAGAGVGRRPRARSARDGRSCRSGGGRGWPSDATRSPARCWPGSASTTCCATIPSAIRASTRRRSRRTISSSCPTSPTTSPPRTAPNPSPAHSRCWSVADC